MNRSNILLPLLLALLCNAQGVRAIEAKQAGQAKTPVYDGEFQGYLQENLSIPVTDFQSAKIKIDNKSVAIDGYWEFKDEAGQLLKSPIILSQPAELTNQMVLALRAPGEAVVTVTEDGKTKIYKIMVNTRFKSNNIEKEVEEAIRLFVNDPGLKVKVLPPQASLVGANLTRAFGDETASDIVAPRGQTAGNASSSLMSADDFRPTIVLEGEVENDIVVTKAVNIAHAYTKNVVNLLQIRNPLQVKIAVKVIDVTHNADSHIGIKYRSTTTSYNINGDPATQPGFGLGFSSTAPFFATGGQGGIPIFGQNLPPSIGATVSLAELNATATLLQEPTLTVLNGQPAEFVVGQVVSIPTGVTVNNGVSTTIYSQQNVGIGLLVTPIVSEEATFRADASGLIPWANISQHDNKQQRTNPGPPMQQIINSISENGIVQLAVKPSVSSVNVATGFAATPIIDTKTVETRVAMKHGESLVIGGLFDDQTRKQIESIPFISKIPILGELFKDRGKDKSRHELVFVLTPTVMGLKDLGNAKNYNPRTQSMRDILTDEKVLPVMVKPTRISAAEVLPRNVEQVVVPASGAVAMEPAPAAVIPETTPSPVQGTTPPADQAQGEKKPGPKSPQAGLTPRAEQP